MPCAFRSQGQFESHMGGHREIPGMDAAGIRMAVRGAEEAVVRSFVVDTWAPAVVGRYRS